MRSAGNSQKPTHSFYQNTTSPGFPSDAEIRKILADRIGFENAGLGIVVGVIDTNGRRVVSYGGLRQEDDSRLDGDTVFEIGSMTKVFTSLVLTDMARAAKLP